MRKLGLVVLAAFLLTAAQAAGKGGPPKQLLGFVQHGNALAVARLDALTLKPVSRQAPLDKGESTFVARVAGGGRAAFSSGSAALRFLDFKRMRWEFRIAYPGVPAAAVWNYADKLVTLNGSSAAEMIVVDPTRRRLGAMRLGGSLASWSATANRIAAVIAPLDGIGAAKLAVIDDSGRVRTTPLPGIRAGSESLNNGEMHRFEYPALALDDTRAVVIAADGTIADVRLDTLAVTSRSLARSLARVRKLANGSTRTAQWIDSSTIAMTGADVHVDGTTQRSTPAGLTLIDTRTWSSHRVDTDTTAIAPNGFGPGCIACTGTLLAYGTNGLAGYDNDGRLKFRLFAGTNAQPSIVAGTYAYLGAGTHFTIVDATTGAVVRTVDTAAPTFLIPYVPY
jgi:hypothetical protein